MRSRKTIILVLFLLLPAGLSVSRLFSAESNDQQEEKKETSFTEDIQPIFTYNCAIPECHAPPKPAKGMVLTEGEAYQNLVNVRSKESPRQMRVASGDLEKSYLYDKITGNQRDGDRMPPKRRLTRPSIQPEADSTKVGDD
jgi:hypothetical protein